MQDHKKYFEMAYRTGTDTWTHLPLKTSAGVLSEKLPEGGMVLDIGCGRGKWAFDLARRGFRVIGIDYISKIIEKDNEEVKNHGLTKNLRFIEGDALDIPFTDDGFDGVLDIGLLSNLPAEDFEMYAGEAARVLKPGGYFLNAVFSKETAEFLMWHPKKSKENTFEKDGVQYHFFAKEKIAELFSRDFEIIEQKIEHFPDRENLAYIVTLMRKK